MTYSSEIGDSLQDLWHEQRDYNQNIRLKWGIQNQTETEAVFWSKQYLLGLVSEIDEVLREINWKAHRGNKDFTFHRNLAWEFADLTKYILSLWELWNFSLEDILRFSLEKSYWIEDQTHMEIRPEPTGQKILVTDLDGTLADWRKSFIKWVEKTQGITMLKTDPDSSLLLDNDLELFYPDYNRWKEAFESTGGYADLEPYIDGIQTVQAMQTEGVYIIVFTARPYPQYKQIWWDTLQWLKRRGIRPDKLLIGAESRITTAHKLQSQNEVILFDDDPGLILRAAHAGIKVWARQHPYNQGISHPNINWVETYDNQIDYFKKGEQDER